MRAVRSGAIALSLLFTVLVSVACGNSGEPRTPDDAVLTPVDEDATYDRVVQRSTHNAYAREEPLLDQLVYHRLRSLELDIHAQRSGTTAGSGDWWVYHEDYPWMRDTSCTLFSTCLGQLAAFHRVAKDHSVVTLFVDLKDAPDAGHSAEALDRALEAALGRENILTPADLLDLCPSASSLRGAVTGACRFPKASELRGKFIVAVTGGSACDPQSLSSRYAGRRPSERAAFVAPSVDVMCPLRAYDVRDDIVFFNFTLDRTPEAAEVSRRGLVARVYAGGLHGGLDTPSELAKARSCGAAHLVTDEVANTRSLAMADESCSPLRLRATSGEFYALERSDVDASYRALVSVPSSHVDPLAKGCLVARAGEQPDSASFAVCRAFDHHPPQAQIRTRRGARMVFQEVTLPGVSAETPAFLRLHLAEHGTMARAEASSDGVRWTTMAESRFAEPLSLRGIAASSHSRGSVEAQFLGLAREDGEQTVSLDSGAFAIRRSFGAEASGELVGNRRN